MSTAPFEIVGLDHIQLAMPAGGEDEARAFYCGLLGFTELPKPEILAARGGIWLQAGTAEMHLGVEADFRPARKAHPGFRVTQLKALGDQFKKLGIEPVSDAALPGRERFFVSDPFGNRLEFLESL